jgi:hypothetical protein
MLNKRFSGSKEKNIKYHVMISKGPLNGKRPDFFYAEGFEYFYKMKDLRKLDCCRGLDSPFKRTVSQYFLNKIFSTFLSCSRHSWTLFEIKFKKNLMSCSHLKFTTPIMFSLLESCQCLFGHC